VAPNLRGHLAPEQRAQTVDSVVFLVAPEFASAASLRQTALFESARQGFSLGGVSLPHVLANDVANDVAEPFCAALGKKCSSVATSLSQFEKSVDGQVVRVAVLETFTPAVLKACPRERCITVLAGKVVAEQKQSEHVFVSRAVAQDASVLVNGTGTGVDHETYFPTSVFSWVLVMFLLFIGFALGASAISSVQVPPQLLSLDAAKHKKMK
jgi:hypothetical protein